MKKSKILNDFFYNHTSRLKMVKRWGGFPEQNFPENVLEHTFKTALLAEIMIALEEKHGQNKFDKFLILSGAVNHDLGEGTVGDIAWPIKQDKELREKLENIEKNEFLKNISGLPGEAIEHFEKSYNVQLSPGTFEATFFEAIERLGYVEHAIAEYHSGKHDFKKVIESQHQPILNLMKEVASLKILYEQYFLEDVEKILNE